MISGRVGELFEIEQTQKKMSKRGGIWNGHFLDGEISFFNGAGEVYVHPQLAVTVVMIGNIANPLEIINSLPQRYGISSTATSLELIALSYHAWGSSMAQHIKGRYTYAIYDNSAHTLLLGRSNLYTHPLYYTIQEGNLLFSSSASRLSMPHLIKLGGYVLFNGYYQITGVIH